MSNKQNDEFNESLSDFLLELAVVFRVCADISKEGDALSPKLQQRFRSYAVQAKDLSDYVDG